MTIENRAAGERVLVHRSNAAAPDGTRPWVLVLTDVPLVPEEHGNRTRSRQMVGALREAGYRVAYVLWERYACCTGETVAEMARLVDDLVIVPSTASDEQDPSQGAVRSGARRLVRFAGCLLPTWARRTLGRSRLFQRWWRSQWEYRESDPAAWYPARLRKALHYCARKYPLAGLLVQYVYLAQAIPPFRESGILSIVDTIDVFHRRLANLQARKMAPEWFLVGREGETRLLQLADCVLAIQPVEGQVLAAMVGAPRVQVVEHGVDVKQQCAVPGAFRDGVVLIGSDNPSNEDGLRWLLREVWPQVTDAVPSAVLHVFGRLSNSPACCGDSVRAHGTIADVAEAYQHGHIVVNPVVVGTGLKIKTVEAMTYGRAVVATPAGGEGLEEAADHGLTIAGSAADFAAAVVTLLQDKRRALELGRQVREYAQQRFSPATVYQPLLSLLDRQPATWIQQISAASGDGGIQRPPLPTPALSTGWQEEWMRLPTPGGLEPVSALVRQALAPRQNVAFEHWLLEEDFRPWNQQVIALVQELMRLGFRCSLSVKATAKELRRRGEAAGIGVRTITEASIAPAQRDTIVHLHLPNVLANPETILGLSQTATPWLTTYYLAFPGKPSWWPGGEEALAALRRAWQKARRICFASANDRDGSDGTLGLNNVPTAVVWPGAQAANEQTGVPLRGLSVQPYQPRWHWTAEVGGPAEFALLREAAVRLADRCPHRFWHVSPPGDLPFTAQSPQGVTVRVPEPWAGPVGSRAADSDAGDCIHGFLSIAATDTPQFGVVEAMHAGVPIVATAVGAVGEFMRHGVEGFLVPPGDPEAIAASMAMLMENAPLALSAGSMARQTAHAALSLRETALRYALLYLDPCSSAPPHPDRLGAS